MLAAHGRFQGLPAKGGTPGDCCKGHHLKCLECRFDDRMVYRHPLRDPLGPPSERRCPLRAVGLAVPSRVAF